MSISLFEPCVSTGTAMLTADALLLLDVAEALQGARRADDPCLALAILSGFYREFSDVPSETLADAVSGLAGALIHLGGFDDQAIALGTLFEVMDVGPAAWLAPEPPYRH